MPSKIALIDVKSCTPLTISSRLRTCCLASSDTTNLVTNAEADGEPRAMADLPIVPFLVPSMREELIDGARNGESNLLNMRRQCRMAVHRIVCKQYFCSEYHAQQPAWDCDRALRTSKRWAALTILPQK